MTPFKKGLPAGDLLGSIFERKGRKNLLPPALLKDTVAKRYGLLSYEVSTNFFDIFSIPC